jgi:hypothetical protein
MRRSLLCLMVLALPFAASAQQAALTTDQLKTYAKAYNEIGKLRDRFQAEFAEPRNKKLEAQDQLHAQLRQEVAKVLQSNQLSESEYNRITYVLSTDSKAREIFDELIGVPKPAPPPAVTMSSNPHVGHVMNSFPGAPNAQGLLPLVLAEAKVVIQHAGLGARNTGSLDAMKQHAGHVLHALEPAEGATGPGSGYGLKKAAAALAAHIELAAKTAGATPAITTHSVHVAAAAKNTMQRADQIAALAREIQTATSAEAAVAAFAKMNTLVAQLMPGVDANGDGKISWEQNEGGLQHVEEHLKLLTAS